MSLELVDPKDAEVVADDIHRGIVRDVLVASAALDRADAMIDEWGRQSFPASDPPSNW